MSLLTRVKAGNITNLSDARYCAAMGVEIIGFPLGKGTKDTVEIEKVKEMMGWLSGVKLALELNAENFDIEYIQLAIEQLNPDFLQLPIQLMDKLPLFNPLPLILETNKIIKDHRSDYFLFKGEIVLGDADLKLFCAENQVLFSSENIKVNSILELLSAFSPAGIELKGGNEISPGLKSFEELAELFEVLEIE